MEETKTLLGLLAEGVEASVTREELAMDDDAVAAAAEERKDMRLTERASDTDMTAWRL